jgi:N-acetylglucosamine kinase-like BadF-type ATPase
MKILVADSGATKTDWRIINDSGSIEQAKTIGFNPFYSEVGYFQQDIETQLYPLLDKYDVSEVHYYGAGCSNAKNQSIVAKMLQELFPKSNPHVTHDLLAAARALCGHEEGIACILGTGANSCHYDGQNIINNVPSLAYVLGDFGSGSTMGKELLSAYFHNELPDALSTKFIERFQLDRDEMIERIYKKPMAATYLASFSKFLFDNATDPFIHDLIVGQFQKFLTHYVLPYKCAQNLKIHFTGSVAYYYNNILRNVVQDMGLTVGNIVQAPIAGLTLYHQNTIT